MKKLCKIILVDDDVIIGLVSKRLLEQLGCADEVVVFSDSLQGLDYLLAQYTNDSGRMSTEQEDLVFLDIEMPGLGGFQILDKLRAALKEQPQRLKHVHFVIITSHKGEKAVAKARDYGVQGILEKPLRIGELEKLLTHLGMENTHHQNMGKA